MASEIRVPTLGESVTEATVAQWFKKPGDRVEADEALVELETDKVSVEVPAPEAGTLVEIVAKDGETVEVGALLGSLGAGDGAAPAPASDDTQNEGAGATVTQAAASAPSSSPERDAPAEAVTENGGDGESADMVDIIAPSAGESVSEADVAEWMVKVGDHVTLDQDLVVLETDKASQELPAPAAGVMAEILHEAGATVSPGDVLGRIKAGAHAAAPKAAPAEAAPQPTRTDDIQAPSVRRIAAETGIDPNSVSGTGKDGRVTKGDMLAAQSSGAQSAPAASAPAAPAPSAPAPKSADAGGGEERVKMSRLRQTIARRLKDAQNTAAMLTTFNEVDMTEVMATRSKYKELFEKKHGQKLGFMSFFTKAVIQALKDVPAVNAEIDGTDIVYKNYYNIAVAVGTDKGLVVPVVRDADAMNLAEIEKEIGNLGKKARDGELSIADMQGGTFTISNGGVYGSLMSTPILNAPQSGILGMHKIQQRPMVVDGEIKVRPMMYLALSYDHRIVDGKEAVTFLVRVKESLEDPARMVLDL
ncbi:MAG: 2-oxoglutarate dehydrogenase complex dihydrolipoyllysine-residue succinyltransferase [Pseudomonadota bacterium]